METPGPSQGVSDVVVALGTALLESGRAESTEQAERGSIQNSITVVMPSQVARPREEREPALEVTVGAPPSPVIDVQATASPQAAPAERREVTPPRGVAEGAGRAAGEPTPVPVSPEPAVVEGPMADAP